MVYESNMMAFVCEKCMSSELMGRIGSDYSLTYKLLYDLVESLKMYFFEEGRAVVMIYY